MCKSLTPDRAAKAPPKVEKLPPPGSPAAVQPDVPFAEMPYPTVSAPDEALKTALGQAAAAQAAAGRLGPNSHVAFSLVALTSDGHHRYGGVFDEEMHFSASLVKVAALYAAHELLAAARRLARKKGFADVSAFMTSLSTKFNPAITATAMPNVRALVTDPALMEPFPKYDLIFTVTNLGVANEPNVQFSPQFQDHLVSMIGHGTNTGASATIRKLSYAYINAALIKGGFFAPAQGTTAQNGIWLAGDYLGDKNKPKFNDATHIPYVRIDCVNDCKTENGVTDCAVAQISTTRRMANLLALMELGKLPRGDAAANTSMKSLMSEPKPLIPGGGGTRDTPWLDQSRLTGVTAQFTITHDKVGVADLKRGPDVHSEGLVVKWTNRPGDQALLDRRHLTGTIAISWQNLIPFNFNGIARVVNDAFANYIATPV
jgi:hypothetical protein